MAHYYLVDITTGDWFDHEIHADDDKTAIYQAEIEWEHLTPSEKKKRTAFYLNKITDEEWEEETTIDLGETIWDSEKGAKTELTDGLQKPVHVTEKRTEGYGRVEVEAYYCPVCWELLNQCEHACPECGQWIEWED